MRYHIKSLYYFLKKNNKLKQYKINIVFVFHTEYLFNTTLFTQLLDFCKNYEQLTGNKVINTIMTGINLRIAQGIKQSDINHDTFIDRIKKLEEISTIDITDITILILIAMNYLKTKFIVIIIGIVLLKNNY